MANNAPPSGDGKPGPASSASSTSSTAPKQNPAFRAMGLPNWRLRLPSRNWMIFLTVTGSITGTILYDRRQKKKNIEKWSTLVEHVSREVVPTNMMPRRVTIYIAAPPGDSLRPARDHFREYIKPVLVAGGMDWDVVEGRREGELRAGTAERIRQIRRRAGEPCETIIDVDKRMAMQAVRRQIGVKEWDGIQGDIVIGRHTWKEYVRGLHEGWFGPIDPPKEKTVEEKADSSAGSKGAENSEDPLPSQTRSSTIQADDAESASGSITDSTQTPPGEEEKQKQDKDKEKEKEKEKPKTPPVPPAHNTSDSYASSELPPSAPSVFNPSTPISFPHILGMLNTHIRTYRFLTRRHLADDVCRETAAAVLAVNRSYEHDIPSPETPPAVGSDESPEWEQQRLLRKEEREWHKRAKKRVEGEEGERVWLDPMVLDERIASRMRKFMLDPIDEERAKRIGEGSAGIPGRPVEEEEEMFDDRNTGAENDGGSHR